MGTPAAMLDAYAEIVTRPAIVVVEAIGLGLLAWVARQGGLGRKGALEQFLRKGKLPIRPATPDAVATADLSSSRAER